MPRQKIRLKVAYFWFFSLSILAAAGCISPTNPTTGTPEITNTPTLTAIPHTPTPTLTPLSMASPTAVPSATPTETGASLRPAILLPLSTTTPFPTVTPDYLVYPTKSVFISIGAYGGSGGEITDRYYGRGTPDLIIYGDGQIIIRDGTYRDSITFREAYLTPLEMCDLRREIEATGFLRKHDAFFTEISGSMGGGNLIVQVENSYYSLYYSDTPYLIEELASGVEIIQNYRPSQPLMPYSPTYLALWLEIEEEPEATTPLPWPTGLPSLANLWSQRGQEDAVFANRVIVEGEWIDPIVALFSNQLTQKVFQEENNVYSIIARPLLPHETPRTIGYYPSFPKDYAPVIDCQNEPTLISPAVPTATPTLTMAAVQLTGQGRIAFTVGDYQDQEIYVIDADGANRFRLTNNLFVDEEPVWSPDGQQIAFTSNHAGSRDIFVMVANGANLRQLTAHPYDNYSPAWSPDGERIAFVSDRDGGWRRSEIYIMNADGSDQQRLTRNQSRDLHPTWSPDGQKIAFVKELSFLQSYTLSVFFLDGESGVEERIPFITRRLTRPAWSPDSSQIAIGLAPTVAEATIRILNLDGSEANSFDLRPLELPGSLSWSADGRFILFAAREPSEGENAIRFSDHEPPLLGSWNLYALETSTGEVIQITHLQQNEFSPTWWP